MRERLAGGADDFKRTGDAGCVCGSQAGGGFGVLARQGFMGLLYRQGADSDADGRVDVRNGRDAIKEGTKIEAGAAHKNGQAALPVRAVDLRARFAGPSRCGAGLRSVNMAEEPVRGLLHFLISWPRGEDLEVGIDLTGVGVDDHAIRCLRQGNGERTLAAGGGPGNKRDAWAGFALICVRSVHVRRDLSGKCGLESGGY